MAMMNPIQPQNLYDALDRAQAAVKDALPEIIKRHRSSGILTWALLHQIEREVLDEVVESHEHYSLALSMLRSVPAFRYPKDDSPVSFEGHGAIPTAFAMILDAWKRAH